VGKAPSLKDMQNVLAVKSVRTMPCKAIGGKKKQPLIKTEETFAEACFVDMAYL